jgi:putative (di)nucleoside polyphosphate hydrolase
MSVRKAVGALILCPKQNNGVLLVEKASISNTINAKKEPIVPYWDIPKGGLKNGENENVALMRELLEELGTNTFDIIAPIPNKLVFDFDKPTQERIGFSCQETTIYLAKFQGSLTDIQPDGQEIIAFKIVDYMEALKLIKKIETKRFLANNLQTMKLLTEK